MQQVPELATASPAVDAGASAGRRACVQGLVLTALVLLAFRTEVGRIAWQASVMVQAAHCLATPLLVGMLFYLRRGVLRAEVRRGSAWGVVVIALAVVSYAAFTWPFYVSYVRKLQIVVAFAGATLAVAGWRVLWRSLPMLLLIFLAVPVGWFTFAALINRPEMLTLRVAGKILDLLPGVQVTMVGRDLKYLHGDFAGTIGLGDIHRGFAAPLALLSLVVFVVYARVRPVFHVLVLLALSLPIVLLANLGRVVVHGWLTVRVHAAPTDGMPRDVGMVAGLFATYVLAAGSAWLVTKVLGRRERAAAEEMPDA